MIKNTFLAATLMTVSAFAAALPITGEVSFFGTAKTWDFGTSKYVNSLLVGDRLDFLNIRTGAGLLENNGTYAGLDNIPVTMSSITYNPFYSVTNPLWMFSSGGKSYSFVLNSLVTDNLTATQIALSGNGILKVTGFDDTDATWSFSADRNGNGMTFRLSSSNSAIPPVTVPEPGSLALLGLGLAILGFARKRQAA